MPIEIDLLIKNKRKIVQDRDSELVDGTQYFFFYFVSFCLSHSFVRQHCTRCAYFKIGFCAYVGGTWRSATPRAFEKISNFQIAVTCAYDDCWKYPLDVGCGVGNINVKIATLLSKQKSIWHCIGRLSSSKRFGLRLNEWMDACVLRKQLWNIYGRFNRLKCIFGIIFSSQCVGLQFRKWMDVLCWIFDYFRQHLCPPPHPAHAWWNMVEHTPQSMIDIIIVFPTIERLKFTFAFGFLHETCECHTRFHSNANRFEMSVTSFCVYVKTFFSDECD